MYANKAEISGRRRSRGCGTRVSRALILWMVLAGARQTAAQVYSSSVLLLNRDGQSQAYSGIGRFQGGCTGFFIATGGPHPLTS